MHSFTCWTTLFAVCVLRFGYCDVIETVTNLSAIAYDVCSVNAFCKSGSDRVPDGKYSCCNQCSCEPDCYIGQRCCPDSDAHNTKNLSSTCKHMDEHFNLHRNIRLRHGKIIDSFYAIESCSEDFYDADVIAGCLFPRTVREHVFVTDPNSMLIYKNYQCAICNDVSNYEFWNLRLECPYNDHLYNATEQEKFILDKCSFNSEPAPSSKNFTYRWACHPDAIDRCNVTGEWDIYNDALVDACSTFNVPYFAESYDPISGMLDDIQIYTNIYCFQCNMKTDLPARSICIYPTDKQNGKRLNQVPIEALYDFFGSDITNKGQHKHNRCKIFEMVDPIMGCSEMLCPFGFIPVYGDCVSRMESTNLTVSAIFEFEVATSKGIPVLGSDVPSYNWIHEALINTVKAIFDKHSCTYCFLMVNTNLTSIQARTTENCTKGHLLKLFEYMTKLTRMRIRNENETLSLTWWISMRHSTIDQPDRINVKKLFPIQYAQQSKCVSAALLAPKFYCKRIQFSSVRLAARGVSNRTITRLLTESEVDKYTNGSAVSYVVCVDKYVDIVNAGLRIVGSLECTLVISLILVLFDMSKPLLYAA